MNTVYASVAFTLQDFTDDELAKFCIGYFTEDDLTKEPKYEIFKGLLTANGKMHTATADAFDAYAANRLEPK